MKTTWHIITGEYPPQVGGVSDYTEQVAVGLAGRGCVVHVWCPGSESEASSTVEVHRFGRSFTPINLARLGKQLNAFAAGRTLLVQYAPNAFGLRGLNIIFCLWLLWRRIFRRDDVRVMFHEPFFYFAWQRPQRNFLAVVNRLMAVVLLAASKIVYISIPAWEKMLRGYAWFRRPIMKWLPIPSTIPRVENAEAVSAVRTKCLNGQSGLLLIGHFGTYGDHIAPDLAKVFADLLRKHEKSCGLFLGSNGKAFADRLAAAEPELAGRIHAPGYLSRDEVSFHLQACDLAIQPYPDGASSRRTSLMAALVNATPTITTAGPLTEEVWRNDGSVPLARAGDTKAMTTLATEYLEDAGLRDRLGEQGSKLYWQQFSLERTLDTLLQDDETRGSA